MSVQHFTFGFFRELDTPRLLQTAPLQREYWNGLQFRNLRFGGNGNITGVLKYGNENEFKDNVPLYL